MVTSRLSPPLRRGRSSLQWSVRDAVIATLWPSVTRTAQAGARILRVADFDVFVSYAHADRERVLVLRDALAARGLAVWLDEQGIETFASITAAIEHGLAHSKALLAFYSLAYPLRRACQWELTAGFVAAQRAGGDPRERVLVVNPEGDGEHVQPVQLRDELYAGAPAQDDRAGWDALAVRIAARLRRLDGMLGDLGVGRRPLWVGRRPVEAARFVGRVRDMWAVHSALTAGQVGLISGKTTGDPAVKVAGMGGIGKSLLAHEYALRYAAAHPGGVFWLRAHGHDDTSASLISSHARDAERDTQLLAFVADLGLDGTGLSPEQVPAALAQELDARAEPFLWVVDDLPGELSSGALEGWLAPGRYGRTLVTTRSRDYDAIGAQIDLGVLTAQEGLELLSRHRAPLGPDEQQAAIELVADLGGHALALDVAGAALRAERGVRSYEEYRAALTDPQMDELEFAAGLVGQLPGGHEASIVRTLARSIQRLGEPGLDFLRLASRLAADPIPAQLVIDVFAEVDGIQDEAAARQRAVAGMQAAVAGSLAEMTGEDGARQVHVLVSRVVGLLDKSGSSRRDALAAAATNALLRRLQIAAQARVPAASIVVAHARHLATPARGWPNPALMGAVARNDYLRGDYPSARALQERVLAICRQALGDEHPSALTSMNNLAETLRAQGDLAGSRALQERVLATNRGTLGDEHPSTLMSMSNLALTLYAQGDLAGAHRLQVRALDTCRRVLGEEHPDTLSVMINLSGTLKDQSDLGGARTLEERVLDIRRRVLGDEHPSTLNAMGNLAVTLWEQGDLDGAREFEELVLDGQRRVLGDEHPQTLAAMGNLAVTLLGQGDVDGARTLHEQALAISRRVLGDEHPSTLALMNSLAGTLERQGDLAGTRSLQEQVLDARRRVLGDEHHTTLNAMNNLAATLHRQGDVNRARALLERAVEGLRRVLGDQHPTTLAAMHNLAYMLTAQGDPQGARVPPRQDFQRAVTSLLEELGEPDPSANTPPPSEPNRRARFSRLRRSR
jgi:tetratricopeptide (TPR) repeat protein